MNLKQTARAIIPKPSILIGLLFIPMTLSVYFLVTLYSNKLILEEGLSYFDVQNSLVRTLLFDNSISEWFTRASDFLFWGVLAAIILVISWAISAAKTTAANHNVVAGFQNFNDTPASWQRHFVVQVVVKILLGVIGLYLFFALLFSLTPELISLGAALIDETGSPTDFLLANVKIYLYAVGVAMALKAFRHVDIQ